MTDTNGTRKYTNTTLEQLRSGVEKLHVRINEALEKMNNVERALIDQIHQEVITMNEKTAKLEAKDQVHTAAIGNLGALLETQQKADLDMAQTFVDIGLTLSELKMVAAGGKRMVWIIISAAMTAIVGGAIGAYFTLT